MEITNAAKFVNLLLFEILNNNLITVVTYIKQFYKYYQFVLFFRIKLSPS